jgi:deoxyribodipyrimidine photo-lyase
MHERASKRNSAEIRPSASYVLYWSQMNRRVDANPALEAAAGLANELRLPLLFYEGLTCSYPYASDRFHSFILEGVPVTRRRLAARGIGYVFYLRRRAADPHDVLYRLAADAAAVVTDDYPTFLTPRHNAGVAARLPVAFYAVDASCIVPMNRIEKREYAAYTIRPKIRRLLREYLKPVEPVPVDRPFPARGLSQFHVEVTPGNIPQLVASCHIDHTVAPSLAFQGGRSAAERQLAHFLEHNLRRYARSSREPSDHATSGLSPYLHFGMISSLEVALAASAQARSHQWVADEFLEQLIVRRELAFNFARHAERVDSLCVLPLWARKTLRRHASDRRNPVYSREQFELAQTHDALWNATQNELLLRGTIQPYYRMYWGKKIIEWSSTHEEALASMIYLHDRYALDGRDPNTYANILWCFGLHDRPWPERPVLGTLRYLSLDGMRRKTSVDAYIREITELERTGHDPFRIQ